MAAAEAAAADADDDLLADREQCPPIPQAKVVLLVNNFVINTVELANVFAASCEDRLAAIAQRISGVELGLALLEAKLNSARRPRGGV
mmetsp:Transcript_1216/g.3386  ORF Transcript_1216/g.3386 Transcript_1216/m.3386 type:complete len:88 (+) Transcript_1216:1153-1416(+)